MHVFAKSTALCAGLLGTALSLNAQVPAEQPSAPQSAADFAIHDGDRVVLYGDSITDQRLYSTFIEEYVMTRFPTWKVQWTQSGVSGDKVSGGAAGPVDQRIDRDILPYKPTVVTIMLGMNDGYYTPTNPSIAKTYEVGYHYMVDRIMAGAPGVRLTLLGPSPFDDTTQPTTHYNEAMQAYSQFDRSEADRIHQGFVDLNAPVVEVLEKVKAAQPDIASLVLPDRVHPGAGVHWVMAAAVLKGWHAPALVSSVALDGHTGKVSDAKNVTVTALKPEKDGSVQWTALESALPLPLPLSATDPVTDLALEAGGIEAALDQETLTANGLAAASYTLSIDDQPAGTFTADALAHGVNLARMATPMLRQSQLLAWETDHRNELERYLFTLVKGSELKPPTPDAEQAALRQLIEKSVAQQQKDAQPVPHHFALRPAK